MKNLHRFFLGIAKEFAKQSTCCRKKVGAVLVKNGRIVSTGYNGVPSKLVHCCDHPAFANIDWNKVNLKSPEAKLHHEFAKQNELHAEQNVIAFAAKNGVSTEDCVLYVTMSPCSDCAKLIVAAGIKEVYFSEKYDRDNAGIDFLKKCGLSVEQVN